MAIELLCCVLRVISAQTGSRLGVGGTAESYLGNVTQRDNRAKDRGSADLPLRDPPVIFAWLSFPLRPNRSQRSDREARRAVLSSTYI